VALRFSAVAPRPEGAQHAIIAITALDTNASGLAFSTEILKAGPCEVRLGLATVRKEEGAAHSVGTDSTLQSLVLRGGMKVRPEREGIDEFRAIESGFL
jgi:hypothetical protein